MATKIHYNVLLPWKGIKCNMESMQSRVKSNQVLNV